MRFCAECFMPFMPDQPQDVTCIPCEFIIEIKIELKG